MSLCGFILFMKVPQRFSLTCCLLYLKFLHICAMTQLYYPPLYLFLWESFTWRTSTCNYLHPAVLSSLLHLITPAPSNSVLQTPTALFKKRSTSFSTKNFLAGFCDLKTISMNSTLAELGMDSMTAAEIKETIQREFKVCLTPQEIHNLTFARLDELSAGNRSTEVDKRQLEGTHTILS